MRPGEASIGSEVKPKRTIPYETFKAVYSLSSSGSISHGLSPWLLYLENSSCHGNGPQLKCGNPTIVSCMHSAYNYSNFAMWAGDISVKASPFGVVLSIMFAIAGELWLSW